MTFKKTSALLFAGVTLLILVTGFLLNPVAQSQAYHNFADQRNWLGIANIANVLSNLPFALAGIWGLLLLFSPGKIQFRDNRERWPWIGISLGLILTAMGSAYYHLAPDNARLIWDRVPMTIVFMSLVAAIFNDWSNNRLGLWLWPVLLAIGIYSVFHWQLTGDLRLYVFVQIYAVAMALVMLFVSSHYNRTWDLAIAVGLYGLAKLFEALDRQIYLVDGNTLSGHTLKHLTAALAAAWLIRMVWKRKIVRGGSSRLIFYKK